MVGYVETLTDPSYRGQILCLTYPLIGNYGVPSMSEEDEFGLPKYFESEQIQIKGLLIHNLAALASHWSCVKTLDQWLYEEKIPGLFGVDTRRLTKLLRINGVMKGAMSAEESSPLDSLVSDPSSVYQAERSRIYENIKNHSYGAQNFMHEVSTQMPRKYTNARSTTDNVKTVVLLDTGTKYSIIRNILRMGYNVVRLPWNSTYEEVMRYKPSGVVISNGPGDPKICGETVRTASELMKVSKPILGICLGFQILALAGGADTYKLKFGHRGQNKPCNDLRNNMTYITSQNHGYGVAPETLEKGEFKIWFSNTDDHTVEGIEHESKPIIAVQFHPEASPGPNDCIFIFRRFKDLIESSDDSYLSALDMNLVSRRRVDVTNSSTAETTTNTNSNTNTNTNQNNLTSELDDLCDKSSDLSKFEPIPSKKKLNNRRKHDTR